MRLTPKNDVCWVKRFSLCSCFAISHLHAVRRTSKFSGRMWIWEYEYNVLYLLRLNPENAGHQVQLRRVLREREPYAFFLAPFGFLVVEVSRKSTWHLPVLWLTVARCETLWSFPHKIAIKEVDTFSDCSYFWLLITSVNLDHVTQSPNKATLKWTMLFVEVVKHLLCLLTGPTIPRTTATTLNCSLLRATAILTS